MGNLKEFEIDWNKVEETSFVPLADGTYAAKVIASEIKKTKAGDKMAVLTFEVLGKYQGRRIFENYMLTHTNPKAVSAGQGKLKNLAKCLELNYDDIDDTSEYHGKPVGVKLKTESSEQYGDKNKIVGFLDFDEELLSTGDTSDKEISVDEPDIVEDEPTVDPVLEESEDEVIVDDEPETPKLELSITPAQIQGFTKQPLIDFIKENKLTIDMNGKKVSQLKDEVMELVFGTEEVENDEVVIVE
jgi:hypothetical protein